MKIFDSPFLSNTLGLSSYAVKGCVVRSKEDLKILMANPLLADFEVTVIGMGSNVILMPVVGKFVIKMDIRGLEIIKENKDFAWVRAGAGENWDVFVRKNLARGLFGLENLALIPGLVGASPIQNIGAYGKEISEFVDKIEVVDRDGVWSQFSAEDCHFDYRNSIFKNNSDYVVTSVTFKLMKTPSLKYDYPDLEKHLEEREINVPTPVDIAEAVTFIRSRKLPDPETYPNVGSFFKNPIVSGAKARKLTAEHPGLTIFKQEQMIKLSAAQLIELDRWKSRPTAKVYCWQHQPLVLVNKGDATANDVLEFAGEITRSINSRYGVSLELEPSILS